jgi:hypothetical protein
VFSKLLLKLLRAGGSKRLHQAAFATGGIVLVDDTLFSGLIQAANGFDNGSLVGFASVNGNAGITNCGASGATESTIAQATFFVLTITLDLRFDVCQSSSSEYDSNTTAENFNREWLICPV